MLDPDLVPAFDPINCHEAKDHPAIWIQLWRSWIAWRKLIYMEVSTEVLEPLPEAVAWHAAYDERITCIALQSNVIFVQFFCYIFILMYSTLFFSFLLQTILSPSGAAKAT